MSMKMGQHLSGALVAVGILIIVVSLFSVEAQKSYNLAKSLLTCEDY